MFEHMEVSESIYEGVVEKLLKKCNVHILTVLVAAGKIEGTIPCLLTIPRM